MKKYDAIVIGAGPGGYPSAIRLAQLGKKTAIVEKEYFGGVCLNVGCIPSKALIHASNEFWKLKTEFEEMGITATSPKVNLEKMVEWKNGVVKKLTGGVSQLLKMNGVESIKGMATFKDSQTLEIKTSAGTEIISAKDIIIATGSRVIEVPVLKFNGKNIFSSTEALEQKKIPKKFIVIGGGFIGLEIGIVFAKLGSEVTIVEAMDQLLSTVDQELVKVVEKKIKKMGIQAKLGTKAIGVKEKDPAKASILHLEVEGREGKKEILEADSILVSVGRKPNSDGLGLEKLGVKTDSKGNIEVDRQGKTNIPGLWAIGDVTGAPQLAHRATMDGLIVASAVAGEKSYKDYKIVPWAVFSDPEIATAGLTEKEAVEKGIKVKVGRFPFAALGKAIATNETDGFMKVLINEKDESIVGVHIVGPQAANLIAEGALAIEMGASVEDLVKTIHTHPTLSEGLPEAVETAFYKAIHVYKPKKSERNVSL